MIKAVILDSDTLGPGDITLSPLRDLPGINWELHTITAADQVAARIQGAEIVLTNKVPLTAALMAQTPTLRYIGVLATGCNVIDLDAASARGIAVSNCAGYGTQSVVQHCFALIFALATRLLDYQQAVAQGRWARSPFFCLLDYPAREISDMHLGIVGYGTLGQGVAAMARALGMRVSVAALPGRDYSAPAASAGIERVPLQQLLPQLDVLSLHCPLTPQTRGLIGRAQLRAMSNRALLINCARGGIVDEQALADALRAGEIAGAGVDVLSEEPPRQGNPLLSADIPNLIVTPHTAWATQRSRQTLVLQAADNLAAFMRGQRLRRVC